MPGRINREWSRVVKINGKGIFFVRNWFFYGRAGFFLGPSFALSGLSVGWCGGILLWRCCFVIPGKGRAGQIKWSQLRWDGCLDWIPDNRFALSGMTRGCWGGCLDWIPDNRFAISGMTWGCWGGCLDWALDILLAQNSRVT